MDAKFEQLRTILAEVTDLDYAKKVLSWDQETYLPTGGTEGRANQLATLARIRHARFASDEVGRLLEDLSSEMSGLDPDSDEVRIVKVTRWLYDMERKLPMALVDEMSRASMVAWVAWKEAKEAQDYSRFAPFLKHNADVNLQVAEALGYEDRPYDALLGRYEPGFTTAQLEAIFAELKSAIVPLVRDIAAKRDVVDDSCLWQHYDETEQMRFSLDVIKQLGYDLNRGRLDKSAHPFAISFGTGDVRITTRVQSDFLNACLFAVIHESGHAMYEQGIGPTLAGTPLSEGASYGVHESQSRLWENLVGRSRPFQEFLFPRLQETFPMQLGSVDIETFYKAANKAGPSLIRVEADEVTYNLHIMLRVELENDILEGRVNIDKLDEVWNERMEQYMGVVPPNDAEGVLQDIHWTEAGQFGIFPSYTLGNIIGAQIFRQAHKEMPDLNEQISKGEFANLLGWLQIKLYKHGRKFTPNELVERITGEPLGTSAWITYIRDKYSKIYGL